MFLRSSKKVILERTSLQKPQKTFLRSWILNQYSEKRLIYHQHLMSLNLKCISTQEQSFDGEFYYTANFQEFINTMKPDSFPDTTYGESRIVIPLYRNKHLIVSRRASLQNPIKYITIMFGG